MTNQIYNKEENAEAYLAWRCVNETHVNIFLTGKAGTGKTTIISSLIKALRSVHYNVVLLAPTGRAAKVLSNYSGKKAYTIHKKIYFTIKQLIKLKVYLIKCIIKIYMCFF